MIKGYNLLNLPQNVLNNFWRHVDVPDDWEENSKDCWLWTGAKGGNKEVYGTFSYRRINLKKKTCRTHRFIYEFYNGEIPNNKIILHSCDNPPCVNPYHLILGTNMDNTHDMIKKNRQSYVKGSDVGTSVLSEEDVDEILLGIINKKYYRVSQIYEIYGVDSNTIHRILRGERWNHHVSQKYNESQLASIRKMIRINTRPKLDELKVAEIKQLSRQNIPIKIIAKKFDVSTTMIYDIRKGKYWSHIN